MITWFHKNDAITEIRNVVPGKFFSWTVLLAIFHLSENDRKCTDKADKFRSPTL